MRLEQTPFTAGWWATSLEKVGLKDQRPRVGTYGCYEHASLPTIQVELKGEFDWLSGLPVLERHIGLEYGADNERSLRELFQNCVRDRVLLPQEFIKFFKTPEWQARIRSNTDCFLDLAAAPVRSPQGGGSLVRFLADSQGCVFWYLYIPDGMNDHAVISCPEFFGPESEPDEADEEPNPPEAVFAEESFEAFMCRFWIENELWFSKFDGTPISDIGRRYLESYRMAPADKLSRQASR